MEKIIPDSLINEILEINPYIALQKLCEEFLEFYKNTLSDSKNQTVELFNEAIGAYSFIYSFAIKWHLQPKIFTSSHVRSNNLAQLKDLVFEISGLAEKKYAELSLAEASEKYDAMFGNVYSYKISEKDLKRIQTLVNELRDEINNSDEIKDEHKNRLRKRLEKFQSELYKDMANFDIFWGVAIEISGHVGQVCENVKPFFDKINTLVNIVTNIMNLTSGQVLLGPPTTNPMIESKK